MPNTTHDATNKIMNNIFVEELRGGERLCYLLMLLLSGKSVNTDELATQMGISRQNVYRMLRKLGGMHVPVVNYPFGSWTLLEFVDEDITLVTPPQTARTRKKRETPATV